MTSLADMPADIEIAAEQAFESILSEAYKEEGFCGQYRLIGKVARSIIARAILAERQRCAEVATAYGREHGQKVEWDREGSLIEACADRIAEIISEPKGGA